MASIKRNCRNGEKSSATNLEMNTLLSLHPHPKTLQIGISKPRREVLKAH